MQQQRPNAAKNKINKFIKKKTHTQDTTNHLLQWLKWKRLTISRAAEGVQALDSHALMVGMKNGATVLKTVQQFLNRLNVCLLCMIQPFHS